MLFRQNNKIKVRKLRKVPKLLSQHALKILKLDRTDIILFHFSHINSPFSAIRATFNSNKL